MATSYGALCNDFYVNMRLAVKMDMPSNRETVLHFFDQMRKVMPAMNRFRRFEEELVLESSHRERMYHWLSLRQTSLRSGYVNPESMEDVMAFHAGLLKVAPYHLSLSPLDIDYLELLYGFDLDCRGNHDAVVHEALFQGCVLGELIRDGQPKTIDMQPTIGISLNDSGDCQARFEVKTRSRTRRGSARPYQDEPISILLTVRQYGPIDHVEQLTGRLNMLSGHLETLATDKAVPLLLLPIARCITSESS